MQREQCENEHARKNAGCLGLAGELELGAAVLLAAGATHPLPHLHVLDGISEVTSSLGVSHHLRQVLKPLPCMFSRRPVFVVARAEAHRITLSTGWVYSLAACQHGVHVCLCVCVCVPSLSMYCTPMHPCCVPF